VSDASATVPGSGRPRNALLFALAVLVIYGAALVFTGGLSQSLYKDEKHNWSTTLRFVDYQVPPTLEELRTYPEVVTPLSYIIWSGIEDVTHAGIRAGRGLEFVLSLGLLAIIAGRRRPDDTALLCGVGLLLYPYLLPLSIHLYTDVLAAFLGLAGLAFYSHRRFAVAAVFLALAIATRQYLLALATGLAVWALIERLRGRASATLWIAPTAAAATIFGWFWVFGGLGPPSGIDKWVPLFPAPMMEVLRVIPEYGMYSLTLIGAYFVVPEFLLFRRWRDPLGITPRRLIVTAALLGAAYALFPPTSYSVPMGALDRVVRPLATSDGVRMGFYYLLALTTCLRFQRLDAAFWIIAVTFAMNMKAQLAWEKYALPTLVALWYLKSIRSLDGGLFPLVRPTEPRE